MELEAVIVPKTLYEQEITHILIDSAVICLRDQIERHLPVIPDTFVRRERDVRRVELALEARW